MFDNRRLERKMDAANAKLDLILNHLGIQDLSSAQLGATRPPYSSPSAAPVVSGAGFAELDELLARGKKIQAIKRYRELTGSGLKDAKDAIEARARDY
ncbi:ribosomal protein L7/L12 [Nocardia callitridis]|uniref:Ribosomal protein L7/L12 n=1 Tax=Nocardia callitridis TaxID=648753 RepID=A0ABP9L4D6_9NOCA